MRLENGDFGRNVKEEQTWRSSLELLCFFDVAVKNK